MTSKDMHIIPINDAREHDEHRQCWCSPKLEWQSFYVEYDTTPAIVIHNSFDMREIWEEINASNEVH